MIWDEERPPALEADAIHGLTPASGNRTATVRDKAVRAVWAWSPRARLLALAPDIDAPALLHDSGSGSGSGSEQRQRAGVHTGRATARTHRTGRVP
ncbi:MULTISPECIES: hypothetical protein [Streptomyces]|uniref:hypothetical protein n=1 Tax=Streptomyces TaxID=1883 RepID=UPI001F03D31F|nr:hypothetical protein [Streptomyces sp. SID7805]